MASSDYKTSADAVANAIQVLQQYYSQGSFAQASYDKLSQDNAVARSASTEEVKGKENEVKRVEMSLLNYKEDHETTSKELDAVLKYLDELKPQCETKVMTYAERKARREDEIAGLKEALEILSA